MTTLIIIAGLPVLFYAVGLWREVVARSRNPIDPWGFKKGGTR